MVSRQWCFTIFAEEWDAEIQDGLKYAVFQKERCPATQRVHYQGYSIWDKPVRFSAVQKWTGHKCHCEISAAKNKDAARAYCMKKETQIGDPKEIGVWPDRAMARSGDSIESRVASRSQREDEQRNFEHLMWANMSERTIGWSDGECNLTFRVDKEG